MTIYTNVNAGSGSSDYGEKPYGNQSVWVKQMVTNSSGVLQNVGATAALAVADVAIIDELPDGLTITDLTGLVSTAAGQAATANIGFRYVDGVDDARMPQSDTAFFSALALNATSRAGTASKSKIVRLPKPAYLVAVVGGADLSSAMVAQFVIEGEIKGSSI